LLVLHGTASSWFLLDVAFYSQNLTQGNVFSQVGWIAPAYQLSIDSEAYYTARAQAIVALSSTVPGYWFTVATIEWMGRRNIQFMGFFFMTLFMAILAGDYNDLANNHIPSFVAVYCLTFFFANWGPNATTFVLPAEVFPTAYRTLGHGISAASGKAGAIIGTYGFVYMSANISLQSALGLLAATSGLGFFCTFLVPETKGRTLEELTNDQVLPGQVQPVKIITDETEMSNAQKLATRV
jgi:PHS family inorganic phosphate transporter-like MFS transporter